VVYWPAFMAQAQKARDHENRGQVG
jgi:hypothetical protein